MSTDNILLKDTVLKDAIKDLYDNSSFSDKYGLHLWIVIIISFLVFLCCSYYYVLNNIQPIKANWNNEKCNPVYMPFAGVIHDKKGDEFYTFTANNFTGCIQTILQKITDYAFLPFYYAMNVMSNIFAAAVGALGVIREMFNKIRNFASSITAVIFDRIFNITAPILEVFINIKSIIAKFVGTVSAVIYSLIASYLGLQSFFKVFMQLLTNVLYILIGVIVALLILSWIPGVFPVALGFAAVMTLMLGVMIMINIFMARVLKISPSFLPSVPEMKINSCFDANTIVKLQNGIEIPFSQLNIGDILQDGKTKVTGIFKILLSDNMYEMDDGIRVTGRHKVYCDGSWIYVKDHCNAKLCKDYKERIVYCISTNTKKIPIGNHIFFDWDELDETQMNNIINNCPHLPENANCEDIHTYMDAGIDESMTVPLYNINLSKKISEIQVGDILMNGEKVIQTVKIDSKDVKNVYEYTFDYGNHFISTSTVHIYKNRYGSILKCKRVNKRPEYLYHLVTDKGVFMCNGIVVKDYNSYIDTYV
jgi:hypothetical protein